MKKKNLGIILIVLGALMLVASYFLDLWDVVGLVDYNSYQILSLFFIIAGLITHIVVIKKGKDE